MFAAITAKAIKPCRIRKNHHMAFSGQIIGGQDGGMPKAFIVHHTGGRGTIDDVQSTLQQRGLGVQYVMDRDGNIRQVGGAGSSQIRPGWGAGAGLNNGNTVGMEVIAKDNKDVTPAQVAAAQAFIQKNYPSVPVYGHGEVNPGHKEADEGMAITGAIRAARSGAPQPDPYSPAAPPAPLLPPPVNIGGTPPPQPQGAGNPLNLMSYAAPAPTMGGSPMPLFGQPAQQPAPQQPQQAPAPASLWSMLAPPTDQATQNSLANLMANFQKPMG